MEYYPWPKTLSYDINITIEKTWRTTLKPALLIIDAQNEYFAPHGKWVVPEGNEALAQIQKLLVAFRRVDLPIFHIMHEALDLESPVFRIGSIGAKINPELDIRAGEKVITKHFPGSFSQTDLDARLHQEGCDTLVITGYMTHMCCDTTTRQASERNYQSLFASDATATRDLQLHGKTIPHNVVHETTLAVMTRFATILTTAEIVKKIESLQNYS